MIPRRFRVPLCRMPKRAALASLVLLLVMTACAPAGPATRPNEKEWSQITADYQWLQTVRNAQPKAPAGASRREQIETVLNNLKRLEPSYVPFIDRVREYFDRTADPRAGTLLANEKVRLGDDYMNVLSRYDRAIALYREALELDPNHPEANSRIEQAEGKRFVDMTAFAKIRPGMKEQEVRAAVGLPREDWIKQVAQNDRFYSVWIYPKPDGGAAAIYFDNDVVYHTNWNAAAPPPAR
jgi:tetratricopeptide (TPR) repeat protein